MAMTALTGATVAAGVALASPAGIVAAVAAAPIKAAVGVYITGLLVNEAENNHKKPVL
jgi:hypothetical protein